MAIPGGYPNTAFKRITDSGSAAASSYTEQRKLDQTHEQPLGAETQTHGFYPRTTEPEPAF